MVESTRKLAAPSALLACAWLLGCGPGGPAGRDPLARLASSTPEVRLSPSGFADVELELTPLRGVEAGTELALFVHLIDDGRKVLRTFDLPLEGAWRTGETLDLRIRIHLSALVEPPPPGEYRLTVGVYDGLIGRFPVDTELRRVGKQEFEAARVRVGERADSAARFEFGEGWAPEKAVPDLQVIVQRPLEVGGVGQAVFGPLGGASELWLLLAMPVPGGSDQVLRPAGEPARFRVSSPCLEAPVDAVGAGTHSVSLRLDPGAGGSCELRFESNAAVREGTSGRLRAPAVQVAAWSAR